MRKLIIFIIVILGCGQKDKEKLQSPRGIETTQNFTVLESFTGKPKWLLKAEKAIESPNEKIIKIYKIRLSFLNEAGDTISVLTSDSGVVDNQNGNLYSLGDVKVVTSDSIFLRTDSLRWDNKNMKIKTDGKINYRSGNESFRAIGFESDPNLKKIIIKKKISGSGEFKE